MKASVLVLIYCADRTVSAASGLFHNLMIIIPSLDTCRETFVKQRYSQRRFQPRGCGG